MSTETEHDEDSGPQPPPVITPEPEVRREHREKAKQMAENYKDDRPTTVLPGSDGMISGTAVTDWLDDEGKPIFGREG
ncbi:hypothetical protein [Nocardia sp. NBC_00511]|uniref:hypothetical protein n=1 Tax=Nocardia sp. NBC_00511 TaxID=2903591 RepID=UPI0030DF1740